MSGQSLKTLPLEWVRAFEAAGRLGSFTAAAAELSVTQATISQRIGHLESRIARPLFLRNARGIELSVDGETWLPSVTNALRDLASGYEDIFGGQQNRLSISASASVIELWLTARLGDWPGGTRPQIVFSTRVLRAPAGGHSADIRVEYGGAEWPDHYRARLFDEALCPVVAPVCVAPGADWRAVPRIALSGPRAGWQDWARFSGDPAPPAPHLRFDSFAPALRAAIAGQGVLLASLPLCVDALAAGQIMRLSDRALRPEQSYWMLARRDAVGKTRWRDLCAQFCDPGRADASGLFHEPHAVS